MSPTSDFYDVQLTQDGVAFAGAAGVVRIANAHFHYSFTPKETTRVLTSEWSKLLSTMKYQGKPILEIAPTTSASAPAVTSAVPVATAAIAVKAPEPSASTPSDQPAATSAQPAAPKPASD